MGEKRCAFLERKGKGTSVCFCLSLLLVATCFFPRMQGFSDEWLKPKWMWFGWVGLVMTFAAGVRMWVPVRCGEERSPLSFERVVECFCSTFVVVSFWEAVYAIGVFLWQGNGQAAYGTFDNPAGLAFSLCTSLPFYFGLYRRFEGFRWKRLVLWAGGIVTVGAVWLSQSRAGWICLVFYALCFLFRWRHVSWWLKTFLAFCVFVGLFWGIFSFKMDSTQGRRFILERSWELVREHPFRGYGPGGFLREYMPCQADYFRRNPDSAYVWLASEVYHPLNEFVWIWIEYGLCGSLFLIGLFVWLFMALFRRRDDFSQVLALALCAILVFALFSYPFKYPLSVLVLLLCVMHVGFPFMKKFVHGVGRKRLIGLMLVIASLCMFIKLLFFYYYDFQWSVASKHAAHGSSKEMMPVYERLYGYYREDALFLYNYAAEQFYAGRYDGALSTAREGMGYWPSYNLFLLTGDICRAAGNFSEAVCYYDEAHWMCPVRFAPLEGLYYAYKGLGDLHHADSVAGVVARKRIKVDSWEVQRIKNEIEKDIQQWKNVVIK